VRIAFVASPVAPLRSAQTGGAQAVVCDVAVGLARRGHEVTVHCAEGSDVPGVRLVTVPVPEDAAAALVMPGGPPPPPAPGVEAGLAEIFEAVRAAAPEAVSQHAFDAPAFELAAGLPVLHTLHLPPIVPAVVAAVRRVPARRLATVSRAAREAWQAAGVESGILLANGVPDGSFDAGAVDRVALVAGRISPEKGVEHALAAARAAGMPVRVAGAQYDPSHAVDLDGADLLGLMGRDELRRLMAASAVTICAVRWDEPFGMVAAEAQMAGCPVAGYRRGALPEVVEVGVSGFLAEPDDVSALAAAITRCLTLDRAAVRSSAVRRLGMEAALDRYEQALSGIAG
jgi:glycosyltransferase involved in cell wall biosynthesis